MIPNLYLVIAGEGEDRKKIENYINKNNLKNKVVLLGYEKIFIICLKIAIAIFSHHFGRIQAL